MSSDIKSILQRIAVLEGKTVPVSPKGDMTSQQKHVPQLPALFKPKNISPTLAKKPYQKHPMDGYMVGENALAEAMQEVEEEMLSKVKKDLRAYIEQLDGKNKGADDGRRERGTPELDKLAKKERIDRDLIQKAVDAVEKAEELEEGDDYGTAGTAPMDSEAGHALELKAQQVLDQPMAPIAPTESIAEDSVVFEIHGDDSCGYEIRRGNKSLPTRFPRRGDAEMAIKLFKNRRKPEQDLSQDYIEER